MSPEPGRRPVHAIRADATGGPVATPVVSASLVAGPASGSPAVERVVYCYRCGSCDYRRLYAPLRDGFACSTCWHALGRPFPRAEPPAELVHEQETQTRDRMNARGGTARHLVRAGKS
jgi:hypothetical protein